MIWEQYPRVAAENARVKEAILAQWGRRSSTKLKLKLSTLGTSTSMSAEPESRNERGRSAVHLGFIHVQLLGVDQMTFLQ